MLAAVWAGVARAATFTVNSDGDDVHGSCAAICTMRDAILAANASLGADTIAFSTGLTFLYSGTPLPALTGPTLVDGTTAPGVGYFLFSGVGGVSFAGLTLASSGITVKNFYSHGGFSSGIRIAAPGGDTVVGGEITGMSGPGILVDSSSNNQIGGSSAGEGLLLEDNLYGLMINGPKSSGNHVEGNDVNDTSSDGIYVLNAPNNVIGGDVTGAGNTITAGDGHGITVSGKSALGNKIQGNIVGDLDTKFATNQNALSGIYVAASNTLIGGSTAAARNVVSGNAWNDATTAGGIVLASTANTVQGNYVGTDAAGMVGPGNVYQGIDDEAGGNLIEGNVVASNTRWGIRIAAAGDTITGNLIGTAADGTSALPNSNGGILVLRGPAQIGGTTASARNVISGHFFSGTGVQLNNSSGVVTVQGNYIGVDVTGVAALPNGAGIASLSSSGAVIGGLDPGAGNVISGNASAGVSLHGTNFTVQGNLIGTTPDGLASLPNNQGLYIEGLKYLIGGPVSGARNVISGNTSDGVVVGGGRGTIAGNYIGLDITGAAALGNGGDGIFFNHSSGATIGGTAPGMMNVISANTGSGIDLQDSASATLNTILGNRIGTDATGLSSLGNALDGIRIIGAYRNTIGGTALGAGNLISGNGAYGIHFMTSPTAASNLILGNWIGTDVTGGAPLGNTLGGIRIEVGSKNTIGGSSPAAANVIAGNGGPGVWLGNDPSLTGNLVLGNRIGTNLSLNPIANALAGVQIDGGTGNTIGGLTAASANVIAGNNGPGIVAYGGTGNALLGGTFFSNTGLPIDLGGDGPTANDADDTDSGPNNLENYPVLGTVTSVNGKATITGTVFGTPGSPMTVLVYRSRTGDPNSRVLLGSLKIKKLPTTGTATFAFKPKQTLDPGTNIAAAASDGNGNSSELSPALTV